MQVPPPPPAQPAAAGVRPPKSRYLIALVLFLLLFVPALVAFLNGLDGITEGLIRVPVPGEADVDLEAGKWTVFYEYVGEFEGRTYVTSIETPGISVVVTGRDGQQLPVVSSNSSFNYNTGGHSGYSIGEFRTDYDGTHRVTTMLTDPGESGPYLIAIGRDLGKATALLVLGILGMLASGFVAFIAWLVVFIMRYRARKGLEAAGYAAGT
ncbi:MAG: hypothetical protein KY391_08590 [Actinobacteria bacterium]|nr:hypothetical protein [Actinomycetota bacterium]